MEILKVSSKSKPNSVAGALANSFRERGLVEIQCIGAGALTVLFRYKGLFPEGVTYAILLMNALTWFIDEHTRPRRFGTQKGGVR